MSPPSPLIVLLAQVAGLGLAALVLLRGRGAASRHAFVAWAALAVLTAVAVPQVVHSFHALGQTREATAATNAGAGRVKCLGDGGAPEWIDRAARLRTELPSGTRLVLRTGKSPPVTCLGFVLLPRVIVADPRDADVVVYADDVPRHVRRMADDRQRGARLLDDDLAVVEVGG